MTERSLPRVNWADVVAIAGRLLPERGIANLTLTDLAEELRADDFAVRYWFQEPGQVLIALAEIRTKWFLDEARARMASAGSQTERLREFMELAAADYEATVMIELWRLATRDEAARRARQVQADAFRRAIAGIIRAGQRSGEFGAVSPDKVGLVLAALVSGFSVSATLHDAELTPEVMLEMLLDAAERMLGVEFGPRAH
ncbi:MAG: TetR family transcriptional regulator C-terminal domain-containing protein [Actinomycetota bacterium]|nr:TetR family transcriptional regulator C-terminal domain-containing protein [Actinomycetota bacterium]